MSEQLRDVGANVRDFRSTPPESFAVIRFRPRSVRLLDEPEEFSSKDPAVKATYYKLLNYELTPRMSNASEFTFSPGHIKRKGSTKRKYSSGRSSVELLHNQMQDNVYQQLKSTYGENNVGTEKYNVDIMVRDRDGGLIFYELKTNRFIKSCIKEALGQILIYAYYPDVQLAKKLVIVSPRATPVSQDVKSFMEMLVRNLIFRCFI